MKKEFVSWCEVDLVWTTPNAEEMIVEMARVSSPKNKRNMETAPKLLRYLIEHKHWSPFEMADMCVEINTTRAISPQILRHRSFSFQEFSQRYASVDLLGNSVMPHLRRQDKKNRQNSTDDLHDTLGTTQVASYYRRISQLFEESEHLYKEMVSAGVAKECARFVLPVASPTTMYMKGSLRSWIHYLEVRCDESTQLEHRQIAERIKQIFCDEFPVIGEAAFSKKSTGWLGR
jgi:thymidylate synthase (FAD)